MVNVNIKFNNKDYLLSCDEGQEENLKELAKFLDIKYNDLKKNLGNIGENKLLLITTIKLIDEFFDLKKKSRSKKKRNLRVCQINLKKYDHWRFSIEMIKKQKLII